MFSFGIHFIQKPMSHVVVSLLVASQLVELVLRYLYTCRIDHHHYHVMMKEKKKTVHKNIADNFWSFYKISPRWTLKAYINVLIIKQESTILASYCSVSVQFHSIPFNSMVIFMWTIHKSTTFNVFYWPKVDRLSLNPVSRSLFLYFLVTLRPMYCFLQNIVAIVIKRHT